MNPGIGSKVKLFLLRRPRTARQPETPNGWRLLWYHRAAREARHL